MPRLGVTILRDNLLRLRLLHRHTGLLAASPDNPTIESDPRELESLCLKVVSDDGYNLITHHHTEDGPFEPMLFKGKGDGCRDDNPREIIEGFAHGAPEGTTECDLLMPLSRSTDTIDKIQCNKRRSADAIWNHIVQCGV